MANKYGEFWGVIIWRYFLRKYCFLRRADTKKTNFRAAVAVVVVPGCRHGADGVQLVPVVLWWWYWYNLSQRVILLCFYWYILRWYRLILYRCFCVPLAGADLGAGGGGAGGGGEVVPVVLGGADTPPSMIYVGTIRGFGMQKFFFEFGVTGFGWKTADNGCVVGCSVV